MTASFLVTSFQSMIGLNVSQWRKKSRSLSLRGIYAGGSGICMAHPSSSRMSFGSGENIQEVSAGVITGT